jgi:hypothetical protein
MSITEYLLNAALVLVVVRQVRGRRLAGASLYLPLVIVAVVGFKYLHTIPTVGNDVVLIAAGTLAGLTLGTLCGLLTVVSADRDGVPFARATGLAAALWVVGIGSRIGFSLYAQHGGGRSIVHFSVAHALTMDGWVAAFVLMALAEAVSRTVILIARSRRGPAGAIISA